MGSVTSELDDDESERAERIVPGGACPDCRTRSSSAVSSTMRGSKSATLAVYMIEGINDYDATEHTGRDEQSVLTWLSLHRTPGSDLLCQP